MASAATLPRTDWRKEWFEIEDATYLNMAGQSPLPKVSLRAAQNALEWKKFPHRMPDEAYFDIPNRVRGSIAQLIGAKAEEIALTTGASAGMAAVAYGLEWKRSDEIITVAGEFPMQYSTWRPLEEREGVALKIVSPSGKFISADDLITALTPRTRLVSASMVRFDDGSLLDVAKVVAACHKQGALFLLDASQGCGAVPMDVAALGVDFVTSAGYKWLLGPYGTGFFWCKSELIAAMRPGPFYWQAIDGAASAHFASLSFHDAKPVAGARRWDSAETASYFNLAAWDASVQLVLQIGAATIAEHNRRLIEFMYSRLPKDRCVVASPLEAAKRGPYGCFAARSPEKTAEMYKLLMKENVVVSLREGNIRVSSYVFNTERDIDRLISVVTE
jgi:cysteine desulfurase / selenocysteine lyase